MMKSIMYHYVRPSPNEPPYEYYYLDIEDFRRQLDHFAAEYDLVDRETFRACLTGERSPPVDALVLTFDDGLLDHYEWVLPELEARDLWGVFFVPGPLGDDLLSVHRVHLLLGLADADDLLSKLLEIIDEDALVRDLPQIEHAYEDFDSEKSEARLKRLLNYIIPYDDLEHVLDELEAHFPGARNVSVRDFYASESQLRELHDAGMILGTHTVTHPVLSRLSFAEQRAEVVESLSYVESLTSGEAPRLFAYPYGRTDTFDDSTVTALEEAGYDAAFTTESADIAPTDIAECPLSLPRLDCNEFPHGDASRY